MTYLNECRIHGFIPKYSMDVGVYQHQNIDSYNWHKESSAKWNSLVLVWAQLYHCIFPEKQVPEERIFQFLISTKLVYHKYDRWYFTSKRFGKFSFRWYQIHASAYCWFARRRRFFYRSYAILWMRRRQIFDVFPLIFQTNITTSTSEKTTFAAKSDT